MKHRGEKLENQMEGTFHQPCHFPPRQAWYSANFKVSATFVQYLYVPCIKLALYVSD